MYPHEKKRCRQCVSLFQSMRNGCKMIINDNFSTEINIKTNSIFIEKCGDVLSAWRFSLSCKVEWSMKNMKRSFNGNHTVLGNTLLEGLIIYIHIIDPFCFYSPNIS